MAFNWQQKGWPNATVNRAALKDELDAFGAALRDAKSFLRKPQDPEAIARALTQEAVKTSAIEGVNVDESVVMSSICRVLGVAYAPKGFTKDLRAEGVAQMMLAVRADWNKPLTPSLLKRWHRALLSGREDKITIGDFRRHKEPMRVVRRTAEGELEIRFEAPPSERVPEEIGTFIKMWKTPVQKPGDVALKCAMVHPHFESIHPFEDGNGRVGRALVAKMLAEGLGLPLILPVSTIIARHRVAYYDEINEASRSLDWTPWSAFFISILTETLTEFVAAVRLVSAKRKYLGEYGETLSVRMRKVVLRMFEDGLEGIRSGLSVAKWIRMTKVSKSTATRDLRELESSGAILALGDGPQTRYRLNCSLCEPIDPLNEPINGDSIEGVGEGIKARVFHLVKTYPGKGMPFLMAALTVSRATVKRALIALIAAGKIEHRGSKKTGGYFCLEKPGRAGARE
ncbi:MAG: DUF4172 domain-containing protein [bacterium]|nr:DUF4172 domain-containing protein [bacterium]